MCSASMGGGFIILGVVSEMIRFFFVKEEDVREQSWIDRKSVV